jgi:hypothetical protein
MMRFRPTLEKSACTIGTGVKLLGDGTKPALPPCSKLNCVKNSQPCKSPRKLKQLAPQYIFAPFRYDCHLDHLAAPIIVVSARTGHRLGRNSLNTFLLSLAASA